MTEFDALQGWELLTDKEKQGVITYAEYAIMTSKAKAGDAGALEKQAVLRNSGSAEFEASEREYKRRADKLDALIENIMDDLKNSLGVRNPIYDMALLLYLVTYWSAASKQCHEILTSEKIKELKRDYSRTKRRVSNGK